VHELGKLGSFWLRKRTEELDFPGKFFFSLVFFSAINIWLGWRPICLHLSSDSEIISTCVHEHLFK
jgi:hypothetical protein